MNIETLKTTMQEAERFLKRAETLLKNSTEDGELNHFHFHCSKDSASVKRASLDLTRSLADLRQGR